jgi:hypothetical protein
VKLVWHHILLHGSYFVLVTDRLTSLLDKEKLSRENPGFEKLKITYFQVDFELWVLSV